MERIRDNLRWMYEQAHQRGVQVVAVTVPPWGRLRGVTDLRHQATADLNAWIVEQQRAGRVDHAVQIGDLLSCGKPGVLCPKYRMLPTDDIHWGSEGHQRVAGALHEAAFSDCE